LLLQSLDSGEKGRSTTVSLLAENKPCNRFVNIVPCELAHILYQVTSQWEQCVTGSHCNREGEQLVTCIPSMFMNIYYHLVVSNTWPVSSWEWARALQLSTDKTFTNAFHDNVQANKLCVFAVLAAEDIQYQHWEELPLRAFIVFPFMQFSHPPQMTTIASESSRFPEDQIVVTTTSTPATSVLVVSIPVSLWCNGDRSLKDAF